METIVEKTNYQAESTGMEVESAKSCRGWDGADASTATVAMRGNGRVDPRVARGSEPELGSSHPRAGFPAALGLRASSGSSRLSSRGGDPLIF